MARKYLKGGALNPAWCDEQDVAYETESIMNSLYDLFNMDMDLDLNLDLAEGVNVNISNKRIEEDMCTIVNIIDDYEAKFEFIKRHSGSPEDLKLAREIIGLE